MAWLCAVASFGSPQWARSLPTHLVGGDAEPLLTSGSGFSSAGLPSETEVQTYPMAQILSH